MGSVLIIDDEDLIKISLSERVERLGHKVETASGINEAFSILDKKKIDLVFLDVNLPDGNGLESLSHIKKKPSQPEVVIITGKGSSDGAQTAIKNGAWDYITKPFNKDEIKLLIKRISDYRCLQKKKRQPVAIDTGDIIGKSAAIKKCIDQIAYCSENKSDVLILGETGTGKELFAKAVHDNSFPENGDYVVVDCAAIPEELTESLLFGHVKGAFTGAEKNRTGLVEKAHKGTLFLDEIGELPLNIQKSFLRVLQEKKFRPVGSSVEKTSDFRLISATNRDLDEMIEKGIFREDLFHRINTISIKLPPLRERKEDIQQLVFNYIEGICRKNDLKTKALLPETLEILQSYHWPGNVRELVNSIEKAVVSEPDLPILYPMFLPDRIRVNYAENKMKKESKPDDESENLDNSQNSILSSLYDGSELPTLKDFREKAVNEIESLYLKSVINQCNWNFDMASSVSGISKSRLYYLIKKYDLKKAYT